jgi:hypothetical protein
MISLTLAVALLAPQDPPPSTQLMQMPLVFLPEAPGDELIQSTPGVSQGPLVGYDARFGLDAIAPLPAGLEVSSFSRGTGLMTTDWSYDSTTGLRVHPSLPSGGWGYVLYSVSKPGSTSWATGTAYLAEEVAGGTTDGDVYACVISGSGEFPDDQVGVVSKIRDGEDLNVDRIRDLDSYLAGYTLSDDYGDSVDMTIDEDALRIYFTVKRTGAALYSDIPADWCNDPTRTDWRHPSTVFVAEWRASAVPAGEWDVDVFKTYDELGLEDGTVIDGLTVMSPNWDGAPGDGTGAELILSTTDKNLERQVWVCGWWFVPVLGGLTWHTGGLYVQNGGLFVENSMGLSSSVERVEGLCFEDPAADSGTSPRGRLRRERSAMMIEDDGDDRLHYALHQVYNGPGVTPTFRYRATLMGSIHPSEVYAQLHQWGGQGTTVVGYVMRAPNSADGYPQSISINLDRSREPEGEDVLFEWRVYGVNGFLGKSHQFRLRLRP